MWLTLLSSFTATAIFAVSLAFSPAAASVQQDLNVTRTQMARMYPSKVDQDPACRSPLAVLVIGLGKKCS